MGAPGLRLHRRTMQVQQAEAELGMTLARFQQEHDLTDVDTVLKYVLRAERHPDDPDRKADEE